MQILALVFLLVAITAWFAPAVRAARNRKFKLAFIWLCSGPLAIGLYMLDRHPNVATGAFVALVVGGALMWHAARK
ncbi:MAG TPA: hypothetical protein VNZ68_01555 [Rhodocyclaceae bacterium]|jgi:hypothetical protein|nr:hypothetical protein [Rhodocyclaceae bacterium]